ncbi:HEAT repeat domain-containing protein [Corallococcus sp. ZKHCc1 1396]|uniref:HEAT repeat domain-containing protein n=1 Tax=Corallococcus soli TaxID=2710757 RepID=A0ABR9PNK6_9BACT|nr:HEAT repeat domain-containing protein [Corallococcus soli]MBE4749507.1 HEAT repeat domain-containing protein [Corallococcus soli]
MRPSVRPLFLALALLAGCHGNRDQLLAEIQDPRPEIRAAAVKKLAAQNNADDLVLFTRAAKDLSAIVRGEAAGALGESQDPRVVDLLGELLEDADEAVQGQAALALAKVKSDKAKAYLTLQYGRRGRATRQIIVQALKSANVPNPMATVVAAESKGLWERNLLALTEGALPERVGAAEELGRSGRPAAVNQLLPMVRDSQVLLAAAAVRGLGDAGDPRAVAPIALLLDESFPELRESAISSLMKLKDPTAATRLQAVAVEKSAVSPLATDAILTFQRTPSTDAALCAITLDGARGEAVKAGRAMRSRGGCPVDPIADRLSRPASAAAGLHAVTGLGPAARALLPKVTPWLNQPDGALRSLAVEAVTSVGDASVAPALQKLYEQEVAGLATLRADWVPNALPLKYSADLDPAAPRAASAKADSKAGKHAQLFDRLQALNATRAKDAGRVVVPPRIPSELSDDVDPAKLQPLATLLTGLGALKAPGALEILKGYADDESPVLRAAALVGLTHVGPEGMEIARTALLEPDRELQKTLALALAEQGEGGQLALVAALPKMGSEKLVVLDALTRVGPPPASASEVLQVLVKEGGAEAALAAILLGRMGAKDAVPTLLKSLDDSNSVARRDVLLALGAIGDAKSAEKVGRDLYHDLPEIRAAAATALRKMNTGAEAEPLEALKGDYFREVRVAAGESPTKDDKVADGAR